MLDTDGAEGIDVQVTFVIPHGVAQVAIEGVDEDLVLIELHDDVWEPPVPLPLHALALADRFPALRRRVERPLDGLWDAYARSERQSAA
jgi:hypothetical protein